MCKTIVLLTYIGCLFCTSELFIGSNIQPKWISLYVGLSFWGLYSCFVLFRKHSSFNVNYEKMVKLILIISLVEILYGEFHYFLIQRNYLHLAECGSFDNPSGYALCICSVFPFIFLFYNNYKKRILITSFLFILFIMGVIISGSRTGLITIAGVLIVYFFYYGKLKTRYIHKNDNYKAVLLIFFIIGLFFVLYLIKKDSVNGRLLIWCTAIYMISDAPFWGHGPGAVKKKYMDYQALLLQNHTDDQWAMLADNTKHLFNEYLEILVQFGLFGFILFIGGVSILIYCYKRTSTILSKCALLSLISIAIYSLFSYPFTYSFTWLLVFIDLLIIIEEAYKSSIRILFNRLRIINAIILFSTSSVILYKVYINSVGEIKICTIVKDRSLSCNQKILEYMKIRRLVYNNPVYLYNFAVESYMNDDFELSLSLIEHCKKSWSDYELELLEALNYSELKLYNLSDIHFIKAHNMCPNRFEPLYYRVKDYIIQKKFKEAKDIAVSIINKRVKVPSEIIDNIKKDMYDLYKNLNNTNIY